MKRPFLLAACAIALTAGASFAADVEMEPRVYRPVTAYRPFDWTGLYFGVNAGYSWARGTSNILFTGAPLNGVMVTDSVEPSGGIAGGQAGFNWQAGSVVVGLEVDGQWSGQQQTVTVACGAGCTITETVKIRSLITARARIGIAWDWLMAYVTFGGALANVRDDLSATVSGTTVTFLPLSNNTSGGTAGAGVEAAFGGNWSAKAEYLYVSTNSRGNTGLPPLGIQSWDTGYTDHIVRAGLNYRFGPSS